MTFENSGAKWVWTAPGDAAGNEYINQYTEFRVAFDWPGGSGKIAIAVDSDYALWVNGRFADCGAFDDHPFEKYFDETDISDLLVRGSNEIFILAYYQGFETFQYAKGTPGLLFALTDRDGRAVAVSSTRVKCRRSPYYHSGQLELLTAQLGFTFRYDASADDAAERWADAVEVEMPMLASLRPRPIEKLTIEPPLSVKTVTQGFFRRLDYRPDWTIARVMYNDHLSRRNFSTVFASAAAPLRSDINGGYILGARLDHDNEGITVHSANIGQNDGAYVIIDLGREEAGLFTLKAEAAAGAIVDIAYGEHLEDGRVRAFVGGRNFACRYVCRDGVQEFIYPFKRFAGRYIQLNISGISGTFRLIYAGLRPTRYPLGSDGGIFRSGDLMHDVIAEVSVRTLELCMHEHYEDCPWREQGLYAMDSRSQALCGYYAFGEYRFPRASLELLGKSIQEDKYLELCAPAHPPITIPCFSLAWIIEMGEYTLFSGDIAFAGQFLAQIREMLRTYMGGDDNDLVRLPVGKRYWNYYDWADGLDNSRGPASTERLDAPLSLFMCLALEKAAFMAHHCGDDDFALWCRNRLDAVRTAVHAKFWDPDVGAYRTYAGEGAGEKPHFAELVQSLALCAQAVPESLAPALRGRLAEGAGGWVPVTLSHSIFKFEALMGEPDVYGRKVMSLIARDWGHMLRSGATSFWETIEGATAFDDAGSLCHGWSAVPLYFYYAYVLGVKPATPGFGEWTVRPADCGLPDATGRIATPHGFIEAQGLKIPKMK